MSKSRRGRENNNFSTRRVPRPVYLNTAPPRPRFGRAARAIGRSPSVFLSVRNPLLRELEDRRQWHPAPRMMRPVKDVRGSPRVTLGLARPTVGGRGRATSMNSPSGPVRHMAGLPKGIAFANPERVVKCVRRKQRKQVLFAIGKNGKNGMKRARRDAYSEVSC